MTNPYPTTPGAIPLPFLGRNDQLALITRLVQGVASRRNDPIVVVSGAPGTGRTTMLHAAQHLARRQELVVASATEATLPATLGALATDLTTSSPHRIAEPLHPRAFGRAMQGVRHLLGRYAGVVLTLDDFDRWRDSRSVFELASGARQSGVPMLVVASALQTPRQLEIRPSEHPHISAITLGRLSHADTVHAFRAPAERTGLAFEERALESAVRASFGHPDLIQLLGSTLWTAATKHKQSEITEHNVATAITAVNPDRILAAKLKRLLDRRARGLGAELAEHASPDRAVLSTGDILELATRFKAELRHYENTIDSLTAAGFLVPTEGGHVVGGDMEAKRFATLYRLTLTRTSGRGR